MSGANFLIFRSILFFSIYFSFLTYSFNWLLFVRFISHWLASSLCFCVELVFCQMLVDSFIHNKNVSYWNYSMINEYSLYTELEIRMRQLHYFSTQSFIFIQYCIVLLCIFTLYQNCLMKVKRLHVKILMKDILDKF